MGPVLPRIAPAPEEVLLSERDLVDAVRAGDEAAFQQLFRAHYERLCTFAARMVRSAETGEEVVQSALLRIWQQRQQLRLSGTLEEYLCGAVRNGALMHLRRLRLDRKWRLTLGDAEAAPLMGAGPPTPEEWTRARELSNAIAEAVDALPPRRREVYLLRREGGLSYAEISRIMNISEKTVGVQIGAALRALRTRLAAWDDQNPR